MPKQKEEGSSSRAVAVVFVVTKSDGHINVKEIVMTQLTGLEKAAVGIDIAGGIASLTGGGGKDPTRSSRRREQWEMGGKVIQQRVADARAAGISPYAALGGSYTSQGFGGIGKVSPDARALNMVSRGLRRAVPESREAESTRLKNDQLLQDQIEMNHIEKAMRWIELQKASSPGTPMQEYPLWVSGMENRPGHKNFGRQGGVFFNPDLSGSLEEGAKYFTGYANKPVWKAPKFPGGTMGQPGILPR